MIARLLAASALAFVASFCLAATVFAHAELVASNPPDGETLTTTPHMLTATFSEEIDAGSSSLVIESAAGAEVARGAVTAEYPTVMTAELPALAPGTYTVRWTSVTPDDQGVERGTFTFNVALPGASSTPTASPTPTEPPSRSSSGLGGDVIMALLLAAIGIGAVVAYVLIRGRR